mgnify:CR=1 FL=1
MTNTTMKLPPIIRSRVGPEVVDVMSVALDAVLKAQVHRGDCVPWEPCREGCPTGIAAKAVRDIDGLWNIAITAGGG